MVVAKLVNKLKSNFNFNSNKHKEYLAEYHNWLMINSTSKEKYITSKIRRIDRFFNILAARSLKNIHIKDIESSIENLFHYPSNAKKIEIFKEMEDRDILQLNRDLKYPTLAPSTIKSDIESCSAFMKWCIGRGYAKTNPFSLVRTNRLKPKINVVKFEKEDLHSIFSLPFYKGEKCKHAYYFWVPLLLRYTGARLNEICSLYKCDIVMINNIHCISINDSFEDKSIKNTCSRRAIPIHSELIRLGFIEFVDQLDEGRLFGGTKLISGYYSNYVSKWFRTIRKNLDLPDNKRAHSFRHTFVDELYQNEVSEEVIMNLVGHGSSNSNKLSITRSVYSTGYEPSVYKPYVEMICNDATKSLLPFQVVPISN
ncbi:site-specific integrase [Vibrio maritimus]